MKRRKQIHRDIKPSNICLNRKGEVKFTDFGVTSQLETTLAACDTYVGTSAYMSPERIKGEHYSFPSDIWSFGLTLLEAATGEYPLLKTDVAFELMQNIVFGPLPKVPPTYSESFRALVHSCLAKDPKERKTPEELVSHPWLQEIEEITNDEAASWIKHVITLPVLEKKPGRPSGRSSGSSYLRSPPSHVSPPSRFLTSPPTSRSASSSPGASAPKTLAPRPSPLASRSPSERLVSAGASATHTRHASSSSIPSRLATPSPSASPPHAWGSSSTSSSSRRLPMLASAASPFSSSSSSSPFSSNPFILGLPPRK